MLEILNKELLPIKSSTAVNAEFVVKTQILGILFSISVIPELQSVSLTSLLVSGIVFSNSVLSVVSNPLVSILFTISTNLVSN